MRRPELPMSGPRIQFLTGARMKPIPARGGEAYAVLRRRIVTTEFPPWVPLSQWCRSRGCSLRAIKESETVDVQRERRAERGLPIGHCPEVGATFGNREYEAGLLRYKVFCC